MRQRSGVIVTAGLTLVLAISVGFDNPATRAQSATPPASVVGVTGGVVGSGEPEAAPGNTLSLRRVVFEPGGSVSDHGHPGALVLFVESGTLTYTVTEGEGEVQRAATEGTPRPPELLGPGDQTVLNPGDWVLEQGFVHSAHNDGDQPTVVWIAALTLPDQPFTVFDLPGTAAP